MGVQETRAVELGEAYRGPALGRSEAGRGIHQVQDEMYICSRRYKVVMNECGLYREPYSLRVTKEVFIVEPLNKGPGPFYYLRMYCTT